MTSIIDSYLSEQRSLLLLEQKAQRNRYNPQGAGSFKTLKNEGLLLHPLRINNKHYGFADYPTFQFSLPFTNDANQFRSGTSVELYIDGEDPVKAMLLGFDGRQGEVRLYHPDFPDWLEDKGTALKIVPDERTFTVMETALKFIEQNPKHIGVELWTNVLTQKERINQEQNSTDFNDEALNESQNFAINKILQNKDLVIVHGPPGTGKTTTLVAAIKALIAKGEKVLVSAPSNAAVDHIAAQLIHKSVKILRFGNTTKVSEEILPYTIEGALAAEGMQQQLKKLRIQSEQLRKMATQYKRNFGKDERDQRKLLLQEVKNIRNEMRALENFQLEKMIENAQVICGTPAGLNDKMLEGIDFATTVLDEAGQCLEPLALTLLSKTQKLVLAGDHLQLPPTVISDEAAKKGLTRSILQHAINLNWDRLLLDTQYRMRKSIASFSNTYFYEGKLQTPDHLQDTSNNVIYVDTAGTGFEEKQPENGSSLCNEGELELIQKIVEKLEIDPTQLAIISPYSEQANLIRNTGICKRVNTVDSFQGQEMHTIIISLVRSNSDGEIGFLKDYRRMNVALTRAKEQLIVIGDSATIGNDPFFSGFISFTEEINAYQSAFDYLY
jgi:ATP-dependent RNA/DNA helicase IGHMBP2